MYEDGFAGSVFLFSENVTPEAQELNGKKAVVFSTIEGHEKSHEVKVMVTESPRVN